MEHLETEGHIAAGSRVAFARSGIAMAVPTGATRPSIRDAALVKHAILGARRIAYSTGPSGDHLKAVLEGWGLAAEIGPRLLQAPPGVPVGTLLAGGNADLGLQQLSELLDLPGIEVLGPLPRDLQLDTIFVAGIAVTSSEPEAARDLITFMASPDADEAKRRHSMEPAVPLTARQETSR